MSVLVFSPLAVLGILITGVIVWRKTSSTGYAMMVGFFGGALIGAILPLIMLTPIGLYESLKGPSLRPPPEPHLSVTEAIRDGCTICMVLVAIPSLALSIVISVIKWKLETRRNARAARQQPSPPS